MVPRYYSVTFPLLFDTELKSANDYGVSFYPSIYIVDQQGKVAFQPPDNELPSSDELSGVIDKLLGAVVVGPSCQLSVVSRPRTTLTTDDR